MNYYKYFAAALLFFARVIAASSIGEAVDEIVISHPEIRTIIYTYESRKAEADHTGLYPDLKLGFAYKNYPYNKSLNRDEANPRTPGMAGMEYSVSQEIPFPGKLSLQKKVARLGAAEYKLFLRKEKNRLALEFLTLLVQLHSIDRKIIYYSEAAGIIDSIEKLGRPGYMFGSKSLSSLLKYKINATKIRDQVIELETRKDQLLSELGYYGADAGKLEKIEQEIPGYLDQLSGRMSATPDAEFVSGVENNPEYLLSGVGQEKSAREKTLGKISHMPDMEVFFSYMKRRNRDYMIDQGPLEYKLMDVTEYRGDLFSMGITMRVPSWSLLGQSHLNEKNNADYKRAESEKERMKLFINSRIRKTLANYRHSTERQELVRKKLIPELRQALSSATSSYQNGGVEISEVLNLKSELKLAEITDTEITEDRSMSALILLSVVDRLLQAEDRQ